MNQEIENYFVNEYVQKQYRDRLLLELQDIKGNYPKRSYKAFRKFSHSANEYIILNKIFMSSERITQNDVINFVKSKITKKYAYYMDELGGEEMPIFDAINKAFNYYGASIIVYDKLFAILKEETSIGSPNKIILLGGPPKLS